MKETCFSEKATMRIKRLIPVLILNLMAFTLVQGQTFTLKSKNIGGQATDKEVYNSFGCSGKNVSPELYWENPPQDTKSFAVTMYDPDAPTGSGFWHWVMFDIPSNVSELVSDAGNISKNLAPAGTILGNTDFGKPGYGGPCPPEGDKPHEYLITIYALKVAKLGLDKNATPPLVGFYLNQNYIAKASIIMYYKR